MKHFYQNIVGWFDYEEIYYEMVKIHNDGAHFVEIGAFLGKSSSFMAVEIKNSNKKIKFDIVDTWLGSSKHQKNFKSRWWDGWNQNEWMKENTAFYQFQNNMKPIQGYYNTFQMTSIEASKLYCDESLDFVYIDAAHEYDWIKKDVEVWLPKVKKNGYLCGHDYIDTTKIKEERRPLNGVKQYIDEKFNNDFFLCGISWIHIKK